jgi:hypothetical protein
MDKVPAKFLPLFETVESFEDTPEKVVDARHEPVARERMFITETLEASAGYEFACERYYPNARAALSALKFALKHPPCAPHSEKLISDIHYLKLTVSADNRRVAPSALAPHTRAIGRNDGLSADESRKVLELEHTIEILKHRVAKLASMEGNQRISD